MTLYRGSYKLPHQSQEIGHDLYAETMSRHLGGKMYGYRLVEDQQRQDPYGYEYVISSPESVTEPFIAFRDRGGLQTWMDAYGLVIEVEPERGEQFWLVIPDGEAAFTALSRSPIVKGVS